MNARNRKYLSVYAWMAFLFITAIYLDNISFRSQFMGILASLTSCTVYICILTFWMLSIKWRCTHRRIRRYIMAMGALMIAWMVLTLLQQEFAVLPIIKRQLWYCSYIPIAVVPLMAVGAADCSDKSDVQRAGKIYYLLWMPTIAFSLLLMTNELHNLVFDVNLYEIHDIVTSHSPMCYAMFCWAALLEFIAVSMLIVKNRATGLRFTRIVIPLCIFAAGAVYMLLFLTEAIGESLIAMPVVISFFHLALCESCLFLRLLPTNFYYRQFLSVRI